MIRDTRVSRGLVRNPSNGLSNIAIVRVPGFRSVLLGLMHQFSRRLSIYLKTQWSYRDMHGHPLNSDTRGRGRCQAASNKWTGSQARVAEISWRQNLSDKLGSPCQMFSTKLVSIPPSFIGRSENEPYSHRLLVWFKNANEEAALWLSAHKSKSAIT